ncbi:phage tail sheath family protein [Streptomyces sp. NPDC048248]|uniref:phage tail sheath family protein n=1 Tax=Streptomyces sp. NPDC048248 TaxID=3365523 RepID=UPI003715C34E
MAAFLVETAGGESAPVRITSWKEFARVTGAEEDPEGQRLELSSEAWASVYGWFVNGGGEAYLVPVSAADGYKGDRQAGEPGGLAGLEAYDVTIVIAPDLWSTPEDVPARAAGIAAHCERMGNRVAVLHLAQDAAPDAKATDVLAIPAAARPWTTAYYPWVNVTDSAGATISVPPSGHVAGVWARVDTERGVHKAPANEDLRGVPALARNVTDAELVVLNDQGVNCLRSFPGTGLLVWGARTLAAGDSESVELRYLNVRRTVNFIKESIHRSTVWAVFEPNDDSLLASVQDAVSNFLTSLWRQGMLVGRSSAEAFYVRCDKSNNPSEGKLVCDIRVAVVRPAEFITFQVTQDLSQD